MGAFSEKRKGANEFFFQMVELTVTFFLPGHPYPFRNNETDIADRSFQGKDGRKNRGRKGGDKLSICWFLRENKQERWERGMMQRSACYKSYKVSHST